MQQDGTRLSSKGTHLEAVHIFVMRLKKNLELMISDHP